MATSEKLTVDVVQKTIHDQIRELAKTLMETSGVKLEDVRIDWVDFMGADSIIQNINITTSKR